MGVEDAELRIVLRAVGEDMLRGLDQVRAAVDGATGHMSTRFKEAESAVTHSMGSIRERVSIGLSGISGSIRAFGEVAALAFGALAGERIFANVIQSTQQWAFDNERLATTLGITTEQAAIYAAAARETGVPIETIDNAARALTRTLNTNEAAFANINVKTRDAQHNLLPFPALLENVVTGLDRYKEGTDRAAAAASVFGGRVTPELLNQLQRFLADVPHATAVAEQFGLTLGADGVAHARAFQIAVADLQLAFLGTKNVIAEALRPELEALIEKMLALAREGTLKAWAESAAHGVTMVGEGLLTLADHLGQLAEAVKVLGVAWAAGKIALFFQALAAAGAVGEGLASLGSAMGIAETGAGVLAGAITLLTGGLDLIPAAVAAAAAGLITWMGWWGKIGSAIRLTATALSGPEGLAAAWDEVTRSASAAAEAGTHAAGVGGVRPLAAHGEPPERALAGLTSAAEGKEHFGGTVQEQAAAEKRAFEELKAARDGELAGVEHNEAAKLAIYQKYAAQILALHGLTAKQRADIEKELTAEIRKAADEQTKITQIGLEGDAKRAERQLDEDKKVIEERFRLGLISADELVALERDLAEKKFAIQTDLLNREKELHVGELVEEAQLDERIKDARQKLEDDLTEIERKGTEARQREEKLSVHLIAQAFSDLGHGFETAIDAVVDQNRTAADVIRDVWHGLLKDMAHIVAEIVAKQAVVALTGSAGKPGESPSHQLAEWLLGVGGAPEAAPKPGSFAGTSPEAGTPGGTTTPAGTDVAVAAAGYSKITALAQTSEAQQTAITQHGLAQRLALWVAHGAQRVASYALTEARLFAISTLHRAQELAAEARALAIWIGNQARKVAIHFATEAQITAITIAHKAIQLAAEAASLIKQIINYAFTAAAGAASAVASIPYVGPILAVANYAAILGEVIGAASHIASGREGFDVDEDTLSFLHRKEMVLPEEHAETIRSLGRLFAGADLATVMRDQIAGHGDGGGSRITVAGPALSLAGITHGPGAPDLSRLSATAAGGGVQHHHHGDTYGDLHIDAIDARSFEERLRAHPRAIYEAAARHTRVRQGARRQ